VKSGFLTHHEKQIFLCDYSNFGSDSAALIAEMTAAEAVMGRQPENSLLVLMDVRNSVASKEAVESIKKGAVKTKKVVRKLALVGVTGVKKIIMQAVSRMSGHQATVFDNVEKAKDWLVS